MVKVLNLIHLLLVLCLDQPIVINAIAILIRGCSNDVKRSALSAIWPNDAKLKGDTKYKIY
jgi:hypothetical protein